MKATAPYTYLQPHIENYPGRGSFSFASVRSWFSLHPISLGVLRYSQTYPIQLKSYIWHNLFKLIQRDFDSSIHHQYTLQKLWCIARMGVFLSNTFFRNPCLDLFSVLRFHNVILSNNKSSMVPKLIFEILLLYRRIWASLLCRKSSKISQQDQKWGEIVTVEGFWGRKLVWHSNLLKNITWNHSTFFLLHHRSSPTTVLLSIVLILYSLSKEKSGPKRRREEREVNRPAPSIFKINN